MTENRELWQPLQCLLQLLPSWGFSGNFTPFFFIQFTLKMINVFETYLMGCVWTGTPYRSPGLLLSQPLDQCSSSNVHVRRGPPAKGTKLLSIVMEEELQKSIQPSSPIQAAQNKVEAAVSSSLTANLRSDSLLCLRQVEFWAPQCQKKKSMLSGQAVDKTSRSISIWLTSQNPLPLFSFYCK